MALPKEIVPVKDPFSHAIAKANGVVEDYVRKTIEGDRICGCSSCKKHGDSMLDWYVGVRNNPIYTIGEDTIKDLYDPHGEHQVPSVNDRLKMSNEINVNVQRRQRLNRLRMLTSDTTTCK